MLPLIKKNYPVLVAQQIMTVQPMAVPASLIYYLNHKYRKLGFTATEVLDNMMIQDMIKDRERERLKKPWGCDPADISIVPTIVTLEGDTIKKGSIQEPGVDVFVLLEFTISKEPARRFLYKPATEKWHEVYAYIGKNDDPNDPIDKKQILVVGKKTYEEPEVKFLEMCAAHWINKSEDKDEDKP
jgi:hypothetical protein